MSFLFKEWLCMEANEYKAFKVFYKESVRNNMSDIEQENLLKKYIPLMARTK